MDPCMSSACTLVPGASTLIWYHPDTQRCTVHSEANRLTLPYKCNLTPPIMCSHQLCVLHWMDNSLISKNYFPQCLCLLKVAHL